LKAQSLIQGHSARNTNIHMPESTVQPKRPKHVPNAPLLEKENKDIEKHKFKTFTRGSEQWSVKGRKIDTNSNKTKEDKTEQHNDQNKASKAISEHSLSSFKSNSSCGISHFGQSRTTRLRTQETKLFMKNGNERNNAQGFLIKKSSSQNDLNSEPVNSRNRNQNSRIKPSVSTSSITSEVSSSRPPCVGILKTPGQRKMSSNRVEFLNNVREREIPS